jgi:hypothetical protein
MSANNQQELYTKIKKRLDDYRYRSHFAKFSTLSFALLLILSLFPIVPIVIVSILGYPASSSSVIMVSWFGCIFSFGILFAISERISKRIEQKRGITLEEKLFAKAYEALCCLNEFFDTSHPVLSGKKKAIRKLWDIVYAIGNTSFPYSILVADEAFNLYTLSSNLSQKLIPQLEKSNTIPMEKIISSIESVVNYFSAPRLPSLIDLNQSFLELPLIPDRSVSKKVITSIAKPSNSRHVLAFGSMAIITLLITYVGITFIGVNLQESYILAIGSMIGLVAIYVTYLGLTNPQKTKT